MTDIMHAVNKASREEEIRNFGKPINYANVVRNKKKYTRKQKHRKQY